MVLPTINPPPPAPRPPATSSVADAGGDTWAGTTPDPGHDAWWHVGGPGVWWSNR
eukprot:gene13350-33249_t